MPPAHPSIDDRLTPAQRRAVIARGNVLVMAGAGTGKTHTLVERCLHCLCEEQPPASLEEILVVTFTEAAAAEMRLRLRERLEEKLQIAPETDPRWTEQLALFDTAPIGTLHSFCLKLIREHFHELGLDPQLVVLDEGEARLLADETLSEELEPYYDGPGEPAEAVRKLIQIYGNGRDQAIRRLILRLYHYAQTRPDAAGWLVAQLKRFSAPEPEEWREWLGQAIHQWQADWLPVLENLRTENEKAAECLEILSRPGNASAAAKLLEEILAADDHWPVRRKTVLRKPLASFFDEADFLGSLMAQKNGGDPLAEDWQWVRGHMETLLRLTQAFSARFATRKRRDGVLDFHDLEQFALKLLWDFAAAQPTSIARQWRQKIRFVFVDEYQDINAAQDKIIQALSRDGAEANRFLVGDVKQSIYRFRLADPKIFRDYAATWNGSAGQTIPLTENFRSREGLLALVNSLFAALLRAEVGGVAYDAGARLQFGAPEQRTALGFGPAPAPRAELLLGLKPDRRDAEAGDDSGGDEWSDLLDAEREARRLAGRLKQLEADRHEIWDVERKRFRPVLWRDMAVLLRAPTGKAEIFAREFQRAGVPLAVERGGFYDSSEILDLLSLLQLLDNPLQDVPAIAVLRSPLVGLSLDELAQVRLAAAGSFWTALNRWRESARKGERPAPADTLAGTLSRVDRFLDDFCRWRELARQASLSQCLETVLAETHYAEWLTTRPRGAQRRANVERLLSLAQKFDQFQRQGLFRFLRFIEAQREVGGEPEVAAATDANAVRLMSIHQSKGLEFPVVALADLAKPFNMLDLRSEIILDETLGLCPRIKPPHTGRRYPSLPWWLAQSHQRRELWGEELRLLYVAVTRARDTLILTGSITEKNWASRWRQPEVITVGALTAAKSYADWLGLWFARHEIPDAKAGELPFLRWRIVDDSDLAGEAAIAPVAPREKADLPELDDETIQKLRQVLTWEYPFAAATRRAAKSSVTALRREAGDDRPDEAEPAFPLRVAGPARRPDRRTALSAADIGAAHHKFLEHVALTNALDLAGLEREAARLEQEKWLSAAERAALNLSDLEAFWNSEAGQKIRAQATRVRRELPFTARFSPTELESAIGVPSAPGLEDEFVVVQGVADLVVLLPTELWLLDFKTDVLDPEELRNRLNVYAPQLKLYSRALEKIYGRPVTARWLHFLTARRTENI